MKVLIELSDFKVCEICNVISDENNPIEIYELRFIREIPYINALVPKETVAEFSPLSFHLCKNCLLTLKSKLSKIK